MNLAQTSQHSINKKHNKNDWDIHLKIISVEQAFIAFSLT